MMVLLASVAAQGEPTDGPGEDRTSEHLAFSIPAH